MISYEPGQWLTLKDPTGVIRARVVQMTELAADQRVDLWGFLNAGNDEPLLNSAWFEPSRPDDRASAPTVAARRNSISNTAPLLTRISEVVQLSREEAASAMPVRLHGVLTFADPEWRVAFLQDESGAIYVSLNPADKHLRSGQWVELNGVTSAGGFAPEVLSSNVAVRGVSWLTRQRTRATGGSHRPRARAGRG